MMELFMGTFGNYIPGMRVIYPWGHHFIRFGNDLHQPKILLSLIFCSQISPKTADMRSNPIGQGSDPPHQSGFHNVVNMQVHNAGIHSVAKCALYVICNMPMQLKK